MDEFQIIRIRTRQTLMQPNTAQFLLRAAKECGFSIPAALLAELCHTVSDERLGIFVGTVNGEPRGVAIGETPRSAFTLAPMILLAYSERAPAALVRLIGAKLGAWIRDAGFDRALALNLRHTDRAFCRGLAHFGVPVRAGGVIAFQLRHDVA